jgi:hypothetical protein
MEVEVLCPQGHRSTVTWTIGSLLKALDDHTFKYYCVVCDRTWRASDDEERQLRERIKRELGRRYRGGF